MSRNQPRIACKHALAWIKHRKGLAALAPLTGQDRRALEAFAHLLEVYVLADEPGAQSALLALGATLGAIQESVWPLAKSLIAMVGDWPDEEPTWKLIMKARSLCVETLQKRALAGA